MGQIWKLKRSISSPAIDIRKDTAMTIAEWIKTIPYLTESFFHADSVWFKEVKSERIAITSFDNQYNSMHRNFRVSFTIVDYPVTNEQLQRQIELGLNNAEYTKEELLSFGKYNIVNGCGWLNLLHTLNEWEKKGRK